MDVNLTSALVASQELVKRAERGKIMKIPVGVLVVRGRANGPVRRVEARPARAHEDARRRARPALPGQRHPARLDRGRP